ncbi:MAG: hypothetical protein AB4426_13210 [Xenococcaceae cyanobacterium]
MTNNYKITILSHFFFPTLPGGAIASVNVLTGWQPRQEFQPQQPDAVTTPSGY